MDNLDALAKSKDSIEQRSADDQEVNVSALSALKRPLMALGIIFLPPILYVVLAYRTLHQGHPPGIVLPFAYLAVVAPLVTPLGAWFSFRAMELYPAVRGRALCLLILFILAAAGCWITLAHYLL